MLMNILPLFIIIIIFHIPLCISSFTEHLTIDTLPDGKLLFVFDFNLSRSLSSSSHHHFNLFPRTLGQILDLYQVEALHLTLTQGRWLFNQWGTPSFHHVAPTGADLKVWLRTTTTTNHNVTLPLDERWIFLTNALSGLFCSSLNFLDHSITTSPTLTWSDLNVTCPNVNTILRHGFLARETVCTENLTPWIKLLPCGTRHGLAKLLNGYKLFDANYHSIQTRVHSTCESPSNCQQILSQSIIAVIDPMRHKDNPDWSLNDLLDKQLDSSCPLGDTPAQVHVMYPTIIPSHQVRVYPDKFTQLTINDRQVAQFFIDDYTPIRMEYLDPDASSLQYRHAATINHSPLILSRYITGTSLDTGKLHIHINNPTSNDIYITMYTIIPWYLRIYLHTLIIKCNNDFIIRPSLWRHQYARDRIRPSVLEMKWNVPADSQCHWCIDFDRIFLHFTEHRPDAHRGFEIGSTVISFPSINNETNYYNNNITYIYTDITSVQLPTPDFSMPYNVITFTSTVLAFMFGTMFSLTLHRIYSYTLIPTTNKNKNNKKKDKLIWIPRIIHINERIRVGITKWRHKSHI